MGGTAARLLSELALVDVDAALHEKGLKFTRFVDDYRIFLKDSQQAYEALSVLAENLGIAEGLSLNATKTKEFSKADYFANLLTQTSDILSEAEGDAVEQLTASIYFDDEEPDRLCCAKDVKRGPPLSPDALMPRAL